MRQRLILIGILLLLSCSLMQAQERRAQNKPYIDLRPLHFGILIGMNMQDAEFTNVGPHTISVPDQGEQAANVLTDCDTWNPGFSVGVVGDLRLSSHFSLRLAPTMHFGSRHLTLHNLLETNTSGQLREETQDMKSAYISLPLSLKFAAPRFNNYRPYLTAGISPMLNLSDKGQDFIQLKRYDTMLEVGLGCDFYLPFFKLIPELKFCYGLGNTFNSSHAQDLRDANKLAFAQSVSEIHTKMVVLTFYFE